MSVKVAINGFGRIGRLAFRQMFGAEGFEVVAINDLTSPKMLAHLLKYDSTQGNYAAQGHVVEAGEDFITVDGKKITIYAKANAAELPWGELGVDVVLECTGFYTSKAKAQAHIDAGAKKVVISAPAGNDLPTIVYNVNHNTLTKEDNIISAASCTTNCLAPMAKALNDGWKIQSGIMCTIHAYTGDQMILDGPQRKGDLRRSRAGAVNIVPNSTGAAKAIGLVIPELNGKLIGAAQRVPTPTGSTTILTPTFLDNENSYVSLQPLMVRTINPLCLPLDALQPGFPSPSSVMSGSPHDSNRFQPNGRNGILTGDRKVEAVNQVAEWSWYRYRYGPFLRPNGQFHPCVLAHCPLWESCPHRSWCSD